MFQLKQLNTICHCWSKYIFLSFYYCHRVKLCHYESLDQFGTCSLHFQFITVGAWWPCTYVASRGGVEGDRMHNIMVWSMLQPHIHGCMPMQLVMLVSYVCLYVYQQNIRTLHLILHTMTSSVYCWIYCEIWKLLIYMENVLFIWLRVMCKDQMLHSWRMCPFQFFSH